MRAWHHVWPYAPLAMVPLGWAGEFLRFKAAGGLPHNFARNAYPPLSHFRCPLVRAPPRTRRGFAAENHSRPNRMALNLPKQEKTAKLVIKNKRLPAACDKDYFLNASHGGYAFALLSVRHAH